MSIWQVTGHWLVFCQRLRDLAHRFEDRSKSEIRDLVIVIQSTLYGAAFVVRVTTV